MADEPRETPSSEVLHVRVPSEQLDRWRAAASRSGTPLAQFVRAAVEARIESRGPKGAAQAVANELIPEIEGMFERFLGRESGSAPVAANTFPVPSLMPTGFDPQCDDAHLHRRGSRCTLCGGSF